MVFSGGFLGLVGWLVVRRTNLGAQTIGISKGLRMRFLFGISKGLRMVVRRDFLEMSNMRQGWSILELTMKTHGLSD